MSFFYKLWRLSLVLALEVTIKAHSAVQAPSTSHVVMEGNGAMRKSSVVRRHQESGPAALVEDSKSRQGPDLYVLIGDNRCDGGGKWKHYELNTERPGNYLHCSASCDSKDECVGFDIGTSGCNMYTQKAVPFGTWNNVRFKDAGPFPGENAHDAFPKTPFDLLLGTGILPPKKMVKCYRKTFYKPVESYYRLIGDGTCSGGGLWKRYKMTPASHDTCETACSQRDECLGFDLGTWEITDNTTQVDRAEFKTTLITITGCFMYTGKPVFGIWPGVQANTPEDGEGDHDKFPQKPDDLTAGFVARYQAGNRSGDPNYLKSQCWAKTHWVGMNEYYMQLGQRRCDGGAGVWKHYKLPAATLQLCKDKCDEQDACIGLDYKVDEDCRLFTRMAIPAGAWDGVGYDDSGSMSHAYNGHGDHDAFPQSPFDLVVNTGSPDAMSACLAKTHFESADDVLSR